MNFILYQAFRTISNPSSKTHDKLAGEPPVDIYFSRIQNSDRFRIKSAF